MNELTVLQIRNYLIEALLAFEADPADDQFQEGYKAAVKTMYEDLFMTTEERALNRKCDDTHAN